MRILRASAEGALTSVGAGAETRYAPGPFARGFGFLIRCAAIRRARPGIHVGQNESPRYLWPREHVRQPARMGRVIRYNEAHAWRALKL